MAAIWRSRVTMDGDWSPAPATRPSPEPAVEMRCAQRLRFDDDDEYESPPSPPRPRRLVFDQPDPQLSPPYKRVRELRLFDSPATPKTILQKCSTPTPSKCRSRISGPGRRTELGRFLDKEHLAASDGSWNADDSAGSDRHRSHLYPEANVNPFTPNGMLLNKKKRALPKTSSPNASMNISSGLDTSADSDMLIEQPTKKLRESNISRYHEEFVELGSLGKGSFGSVHRCLNRLDGCEYAIKRSLRPVTGSQSEKAALNEVYAHAVLGKHQHVVRYYSAWAEDDHMIIQNEYCDGGSLQDYIATKGPLPEPKLLVLIWHIADGLKYIHSMQLVHMDIKPGNIFLAHEVNSIADEEGDVKTHYDSADDGFDEHDDQISNYSEVTYKIGDLGHVTTISAPQLEEGDCRYLSNEVLQEDINSLAKADIFAFGLTIYEAAGSGPLPKNGDEWHDIRNGNIKELPNYSRDLIQLIKSMIDPDPTKRPSAAQIVRHPLMSQGMNKSNADLRRELEAIKLKNELLSKQLQEATRCIKSMAPTVAVALSNNNNNETSIKRNLKSKTRSGCGRLSPKQCILTADTQRTIGAFTRKNTRSFKFGRSNSNVNF